MNKKLFVLWIIMLGAIHNYGKAKSDIFTIPHFNQKVVVDGKIEDDLWNKIPSQIHFIAPWNRDVKDHTTFKCYTSNSKFYFFFNVKDRTLIVNNVSNESEIGGEDRVEIFLTKDKSMNPYFGMEIDAKARVMDYKSKYYRKSLSEWDFKTLKLKSNICSKGYTVEGSLSIDEMKQIGLGKNFYMGVFRADYYGDQYNDVTWFSWQRPDSKTPDFHIPSAFREVRVK